MLGQSSATAAAALGIKDAISWWDAVNKSVAWQDRIFHVLAVLYGLVSAIALVCIFFLSELWSSTANYLRVWFSRLLCPVFSGLLLDDKRFSVLNCIIIEINLFFSIYADLNARCCFPFQLVITCYYLEFRYNWWGYNWECQSMVGLRRKYSISLTYWLMEVCISCILKLSR